MTDNSAVCLGPSQLGLGVFAKRSFRPGEIISEISGKLVRHLDPSNDTYLDLGRGLTLEPDPPFNHLNHSCEPNCRLDPRRRRSKATRRFVPAMFLKALRGIYAGEELRNHYAWPAEVAIPCRCGSRKCLGWVVAKRELKSLLKPANGRRRGRNKTSRGFPLEFSELLTAVFARG